MLHSSHKITSFAGEDVFKLPLRGLPRERFTLKIFVLQHTPSEGPGAIRQWANKHGHQLFIYHPAQFGILPQPQAITADDLLVILGGPMSPNDNLAWIIQERTLIAHCLNQHTPIFGACYGAQQIAKVLGGTVKKAPHKEVGWDKVTLHFESVCDIAQLKDLPKTLDVIHWHEEMFTIPKNASLLFESQHHHNQGFIYHHKDSKAIGLQFHFELLQEDILTMCLNDGAYALEKNVLSQSPQTISKHGVPSENAAVLFQLLDYLTA